MDLFQAIQEVVFQKQSSIEKRLRKKALRRAHRGTNWKFLEPREGYLRFKIPGTKRYVLKRMSPTQRVTKKQIGRGLGIRSHLFK
jgi:hypothetical protein